jgi:hypothetical protein
MRLAMPLLATAFLGAAPLQDLQPIFNGKDLSGWKVPTPNPWWTAADGVLAGQSDEKLKGHVLQTEKAYRDFVFEGDFRFEGDIDSGVLFRKPDLQVQIGVSRKLKKDMTGSIYARGGYPGQAQGVDALLKAGDWNTMKLEARGSKFKVWLNGKPVLEYEDDKSPDAAPIGLQIHAGVKMKVEFRNLKVAELGK